LKPYRMSKKFQSVWEVIPDYQNKGSSIWAYRSWKNLKLNDDYYNESIISKWIKEYFDNINDKKYAYSPGKLLELGLSQDFKVESQSDKFKKLYTRGVK